MSEKLNSRKGEKKFSSQESVLNNPETGETRQELHKLSRDIEAAHHADEYKKALSELNTPKKEESTPAWVERVKQQNPDLPPHTRFLETPEGNPIVELPITPSSTDLGFYEIDEEGHLIPAPNQGDYVETNGDILFNEGEVDANDLVL